MGENILQDIQAAWSTPVFQFWKVSHLFVYYLFIYLFTYLFIYQLLLLLFLLMYMYIYIYIFIIFFYIFYLTYASKARTVCIIVPYNDALNAATRLSGRRRSCLAFVRSEMFRLGIAPKEKYSRLFNPVSIQE